MKKMLKLDMWYIIIFVVLSIIMYFGFQWAEKQTVFTSQYGEYECWQESSNKSNHAYLVKHNWVSYFSHVLVGKIYLLDLQTKQITTISVSGENK
jgi:hypothetical protein